MENNSGQKLIVIGPKTGIKGGASVSFNHLLDELDSRGVSYTCIDMPGGNYSLKRFFMIAKYLFQFLTTIKKGSVISLHASDNSTIVYTIILDRIAYFTDSKLLIRVFGGQHLDTLKRTRPFFKQRVIECYKRHTLLLQTKNMISRSREEFGLQNVKWFPTSRPSTTPKLLESFQDSVPLKILYISQVRWNKGIDRCIELAMFIHKKKLNAKILVYGELFDETYKIEIDKISDGVITYQGVAESDRVYDLMRKSDLLFFPSRYSGEGYPGVIVEAINVQLPVVATDMKNIRDLIDDEKDGLLVDFYDKNAVFNRIKELINHREKLKGFHKNLEQKRNQFSSEYWNGDFFMNLVEEVRERGQK